MTAVAPQPEPDPAAEPQSLPASGSTEYATRGARVSRHHRPHLRMVSPLRPERASRGVFALVVSAVLIVGMVVILVINTSLAQGAFTVTELRAERTALAQQEQRLVEAVTAAGAPELLENRARELGMVPSETPVFLRLPGGKVLGNPRPARGGTQSVPRLLTPADATAAEAVDNASVGTDLPVAPGADYDPAAADAAAAQAAAANAEALGIAPDSGRVGVTVVLEAARAAAAQPSEENLWEDSTVIDVTEQVGSGDADLEAVVVP